MGKTGPYLQLILIIVESAAVIIVARVFELALGTQATTTGVDSKGNNAVYIVTFSMPQLLVRPFSSLFILFYFDWILMKGIVPLTILITVLAGLTSNHSWGNDEIEQQRPEGSIVGGLVFAPPTTRSHLHTTTIR